MSQRYLKVGMCLGAAVVMLVLAKPAHAQVSFLRAVKQQDQVQLGKKAYQNRCSGCHGMTGDGKGPAAPFLDPKPRDFTTGLFKLKTTPIGAQPTNQDLLKIIDKGIPGTSMPSFRLVSLNEKQAMVEYIKTLAPKAWKDASVEDVVPPLPMPAGVFTKRKEFVKYALKGRVWFQELGCVSCHGISGKGDGSSSEGLKDSWDHMVVPADLTQKTVKRGNTVQDLAYSIMMGLDGTPMPAHGDILDSLVEAFPELQSKPHIWELAAYVLALRGQADGMIFDEIKPIPAGGIPAEEVNALVGKYLQ